MKIFAFSLATLLAFFGLFAPKVAPTPATVAPCTACDALSGAEKVVCLADDFKATLSASQITTLELAYTLTNAAKWSNLPVTFVSRLGLRFGDLSAAQLAAAKAVIKAAMGTGAQEGYSELEELWAADAYLAANGGGSTYGAGQYYIAFLGAPSLTGTWQLYAGGHHVAISNTYKNGVLAGATPSFRAVEPFDAFTTTGGATAQPMIEERTALAAMLGGLSTSELATAKISTTFNDILLGPGKDWQFPTAKLGIKCSALTAAQKALVVAAIRTYVEDIDDASAAAIMAVYESQIDDTYIAFSGNAALTAQKDYVRIDGPRVWIEYSTQNGIVLTPKHPHSVWRDRSTDYGGLGGPVSTNSTAAFEGKFLIFPSPATDASTVQIGLEKAATVSVSIFDIAGKKVGSDLKMQASAGEHRLKLETASLPNGLFRVVLQVKNADGSTASASKPLVKI